jgi:hypothetical protein
MCERCDEIDHTIQRYQAIHGFMDQATVERAKELIAVLEKEKAALHPPISPAVP